MKRKKMAGNWHFFVSDSANIAKLTQSVGFNYKWINNQFVHPTGLIALAPDGKIVSYLRGIEFLPFDIKITMVEAANGKSDQASTGCSLFVILMTNTGTSLFLM